MSRELSSGCDLIEEFWLFHHLLRIECLFCHFKQLCRCPLKCLKYLLVLSQTRQHSWIHTNCDFKSCLSEAHDFCVRSTPHCSGSRVNDVIKRLPAPGNIFPCDQLWSSPPVQSCVDALYNRLCCIFLRTKPCGRQTNPPTNPSPHDIITTAIQFLTDTFFFN